MVPASLLLVVVVVALSKWVAGCQQCVCGWCTCNASLGGEGAGRGWWAEGKKKKIYTRNLCNTWLMKNYHMTYHMTMCSSCDKSCGSLLRNKKKKFHLHLLRRVTCTWQRWLLLSKREGVFFHTNGKRNRRSGIPPASGQCSRQPEALPPSVAHSS